MGELPFDLVMSLCPGIKSFTIVLECSNPQLYQQEDEEAVNYLTEIESEMHWQGPEDLWQQDVASHVGSARRIRRKYREHTSREKSRWEDISFKVSVLSVEVTRIRWDHEIVHLPPIHMKSQNRIFKPFTWPL
jgi:hypothetical protein